MSPVKKAKAAEQTHNNVLVADVERSYIVKTRNHDRAATGRRVSRRNKPDREELVGKFRFFFIVFFSASKENMTLLLT